MENEEFMKSLNLSTAEENQLLRFALERGIMDYRYAWEEMQQEEKRQVLRDKKYGVKIWQGADKTKRWRGYAIVDGKRVKVTGKMHGTKEDIENLLYDKIMGNTVATVVTFSDMYSAMKKRKKQLNRDEATIARYDRTYHSHFSDIAQKPIKEFTPKFIKQFCVERMDKKISKSEFKQLKSLIKAVMIMAKDEEQIDWSVSHELQDIWEMFDSIAFRKARKTNDQLVFTDEERDKLFSVIDAKGKDLINLAIMLDFKTGLRPGELLALTFNDVKDNYVSVNKQEVEHRHNGKSIYEIKNLTKTEAGDRIVFIAGDTSEYLSIIERIKALSDGPYLFMKDGKRINQKQVRDRLARLCKEAGITVKSTNKIRKTYASMLYEQNVNPNIIKKQCGHADITTTERFYVKDRMPNDYILNQLKSVSI